MLLVRSRQHAGWGLPGGLVRRGEAPVDGLARELAEELAAVVSPDELAVARTQTLVDPVVQQVTVVFGITLSGEPVVDGAEVVEARWFAVADLPVALVRGTYESLEIIGAVPSRAAR